MQKLQQWMMVGGIAVALSFSAAARTENTVSTTVKSVPVSAPAQVNTGGFPERVQVGNRNVSLNGSGTRFRAMFQVYKAGLYTEKGVQSWGELSNANEAKRIQMVMLREVNANELGSMFVRGIQENMDKGTAARLMPAMLRMSALFSEYKKLDAGDQLAMDWVPGKGTVITVKGEVAGEPVADPAFYQALVGIWVGPTPADWKLRDALLGVKSTTETANRQ